MNERYCPDCKKKGKKVALKHKYGIEFSRRDKHGYKEPEHPTDYYECPECDKTFYEHSDGKLRNYLEGEK
jgi:ribosomal protein L37AE/L43A